MRLAIEWVRADVALGLGGVGCVRAGSALAAVLAAGAGGGAGLTAGAR